MASTPPIPSVGAIDEVSQQFNLAKSFGGQAFASAFQQIAALQSFVPEEITFDTSFTVPDALLSGFARPDRPDSPSVTDFDVDVPSAPEFNAISIPDFGTAPTFDKDAPYISFAGKPTPFAKTPPQVPELFPVEIPDAPEIGFPELPTLEELQLPDPPTIVEHEFTAEVPEFSTPVPADGLDYSVTPYTEKLLGDVRAEVSRQLQQGTGLPPAIEQALFDRSRDREDVAALQAEDEVMTDFASRGFTLPSGIQAKRLKEIQQQNLQNRSSLNRELTIAMLEREIETLRFAVQQGIAAESLTADLHFKAEELKLQVATTVATLALQVFDAEISVYNAQVQVYQAQAQVFRDLIAAEMTKVERFRAQLEAERVRGELNQQKIELYVARLQGLNTLVAIYTSQVDAANAVAATNETRIRGYAAQVDAFRSEVAAKESEFSAWATGIRGELGKIDAFQAETQAFVARTQAYATGVEAKAIAPRLNLEQQVAEAEAFRAEIAGVQAKIGALAQKAQSIAQIFSSEASIYAAEGQISVAEAETNTRQYLALVEESRTKAQVALGNAELLVQQSLGQDNQIVEAIRGAAQAASQLAAASFSAVNASASISESGSASNSWGFQENWNKDTT